jgi:hypothetical protein
MDCFHIRSVLVNSSVQVHQYYLWPLHSDDFAATTLRMASAFLQNACFQNDKHSQHFTEAQMYHPDDVICSDDLDFRVRTRPIWIETCRIPLLFAHFHTNAASYLRFLDHFTPLVSMTKMASPSNAFRQTQSSLGRSMRANRIAAVSCWGYMRVWKCHWWWYDRLASMHDVRVSVDVTNINKRITCLSLENRGQEQRSCWKMKNPWQ